MIKCLTAINKAQSDFYTAGRRFGSLQEVLPLVIKQLSQSEVDYCMEKYVIQAVIQPDGYRIVGIPAPKSVARRSFFMNQSGVIRESWTPELATENSAVIK